ncbi:50S ribosomal protein L31 [Patescibacteria group bacterium]
MKKNTHPTYYPNAKVVCGCGNSFEIGSTQERIEVEICSACHPFYTGKERIIETGQVERFRKRLAKRNSTFNSKKKK